MSLNLYEPLLGDLLSALRRHHRADSERLLQRWRDEPIERDDDDDEAFWQRVDDIDVTTWVQREAALHVAGGRFEHALCLVENNRPWFRDKEEDHP